MLTQRALNSWRSFAEVCTQLGVTADMINDAIADAGVIEIALDCCTVQPSPIHGNGLFAARGFQEGDWIVPMRIDGTVTHLGAVSNHGLPNAVLARWPNGNLHLLAITTIAPGDEILHDYAYCLWCTTEEPSY